MLSVNIRNDFLKISKLQDCPERETQVASDLILSEMKPLWTGVRVTSPGFSVECAWKDIAEQKKKDIHLLFWIIPYQHVSSLVRDSLLLLCGQASYEMNDERRWISKCSKYIGNI